MLGVLARFLRRCNATGHALRGRLAWRLGLHRRARHHFERVLALGGSEFTAYVHLGRIALGEGDYAGHRREMSNARACDPERFARLRIPSDGLEPRVAGTPYEETGERATWRSVRPVSGLPRRPSVRSAELPTDLGADDMRASHLDSAMFGLEEAPSRRRDDFASASERERFANLPPIRPGDVARTDFDELTKLLGN